MTEALENSEELPENSLQSTDNVDSPTQIEKRGRGRPKGSVDKAPRKRTKIIEEPVTPPPPPPPPAPIAPAEPVRQKTRRTPPPRADTPIPYEATHRETPPAPLSPRTLFKQASQTIHQLQSEREHQRRQYWAEQIGKSLR